MLLAGLTLALTSCGGSAELELIPKTVLFGNPEKMMARISPDGTKLAYIAPSNDVLNVWVKTIGENDDRAVTSDDNRGIFRYFWAQDGEHVLYMQDAGGDENWLLYAVNVESGDVRTLTPYEGVQVRLVDYSKHHPNTIILAMNEQDPRLHDVYSLELDTGEMTLIARNPGNILGWMTDFDLKVRGAVAMTPAGETELLVRKDEDATWESILVWGDEDNMVSSPLGFTKDGRSMYMVDSRGANAGRLVKLDLETKETRDHRRGSDLRRQRRHAEPRHVRDRGRGVHERPHRVDGHGRLGAARTSKRSRGWTTATSASRATTTTTTRGPWRS